MYKYTNLFAIVGTIRTSLSSTQTEADLTGLATNSSSNLDHNNDIVNILTLWSKKLNYETFSFNSFSLLRWRRSTTILTTWTMISNPSDADAIIRFNLKYTFAS